MLVILAGLESYCAIQCSENGVLLKESFNPDEPVRRKTSKGAVAQLVERLLCKQDVRSSSLLCSTTLLDRSGL